MVGTFSLSLIHLEHRHTHKNILLFFSAWCVLSNYFIRDDIMVHRSLAALAPPLDFLLSPLPHMMQLDCLPPSPTAGLDSSSSSSQHLSDTIAPWPSSSLESSSGSPPHYSELIDNSTRRYRSVRLTCGVTLQVGEDVVETCPGILEDLNHDLIGCLSVLPSSVRRLVRRTKIWVNRR